MIFPHGGISRRDVLIGIPLLLASRFVQAGQPDDVSLRLRAIEETVLGRLGVAALDTQANHRISYRAAELWPLCSTFKFLLTPVRSGLTVLLPLVRPIYLSGRRLSGQIYLRGR